MCGFFVRVCRYYFTVFLYIPKPTLFFFIVSHRISALDFLCRMIVNARLAISFK